jgi:hypothetical protein
MTFLSHCHPSFESVFSIEAVNEPIRDATQTPGLGKCKSPASRPRLAFGKPTHASDRVVYENFVQTVRLVEWFIQKKWPEVQHRKLARSKVDLREVVADASMTITYLSGLLPDAVIDAVTDAFTSLNAIAEELGLSIDSCGGQELSPITTKLVFSPLSSLSQ